MSPVYLKSAEGKRLLAYFFGLHPTLVLDIHAVMKAQMPGAKKGVLAAYGEVRVNSDFICNFLIFGSFGVLNLRQDF